MTRTIIDVRALEGMEVAETSEAKDVAMDIVQDALDHAFWLCDSEEPDNLKEMQGHDAISVADKIVESLIGMGWRPTE